MSCPIVLPHRPAVNNLSITDCEPLVRRLVLTPYSAIRLGIDPFTVYVTGKFEVRMSGSESSFHPIELCVNQRISLQDKMPTFCVVDCENRTSSGVKFFRIPAGSHPFKKIDDICVCKLLNGQTGTIQFGKVGKIFTDSTFPDQ